MTSVSWPPEAGSQKEIKAPSPQNHFPHVQKPGAFSSPLGNYLKHRKINCCDVSRWVFSLPWVMNSFLAAGLTEQRSLTTSSVITYGCHMAPPCDADRACCIVNAPNKREADGRGGATVLTAKFSLPSHGNTPGNVRRNILRRTRGVLRDAAVLCVWVFLLQ